MVRMAPPGHRMPSVTGVIPVGSPALNACVFLIASAQVFALGSGLRPTTPNSILGQHDAPVTALCLSDDGTLLTSRDVNGLIHAWSYPSGRKRLTIPTGSANYFGTISLSPDGKRL